jgi:ubiquinone/menaquinone biosynthesis C-methylase UbiE
LLALKLDTIEIERIRRFTGEQSGGKLLDLGCGTGLHALELCADFWVTAIDIGPSHLERKHKCLTCIQGDVRHLTRLTDEQFDVVLLNGLVQYLTKAEIAQMAEDLRVAMHPGGLLLIKHPAPVDGVDVVSESPRDGLSNYYSNHWADDTLVDLLAAFTLDHTEQAFTNDDLGKDFCKVESCPDTIQQWMVFRRGI